MSNEEFDREVLGPVNPSRRAFLRKLVVGAAFAAPAIASFNMVGLGAMSADALSANQAGVRPGYGSGDDNHEHVGPLGTEFPNDRFGNGNGDQNHNHVGPPPQF